MIELIRVHRDAKGTGRWLEPVCEHIRSMSARFDGNPDALVDEVYKKWAEKSPLLGLFVGIEDDQIVGHILAFIKEYDGRWVAWITEVESDQVVSRSFRDHTLAILGEWVHTFNFTYKAQGIYVGEMMNCTPHMKDAWSRHSGFLPYRFIMIRKIPPEVK